MAEQTVRVRVAVAVDKHGSVFVQSAVKLAPNQDRFDSGSTEFHWLEWSVPLPTEPEVAARVEHNGETL